MLGPEEKAALKKAMGAVASGKMKPGDSMIVKGKTEAMPEEDGGEGGEYDTKEHLRQIAGDLVSALKTGDVDAVADLLQECFDCLDAAPHVEGPHE